MNAVVTVAAVIAVTEAIKTIVPAKIDGIVTMIIAVVIGAVAGFFNVEGLNVATGIIVGLGAVGTHTALKAVGGK